MSIDLALRPGDTEPVAALLVASVAYLVFDYGTRPTVLEPWLARRGAQDPQALSVLVRRAIGGVFLFAVAIGFGLGFGHSPADYGLRWPAPLLGWLALAIGPFLVLLPVLFTASRRPALWQSYPEIRAKVWTKALVKRSALLWAVYLLGYEMFFRGFLLVTLVAAWGTWPGIAVAGGLYVFAHLTKDPGECFGSVAMAVVFSLVALISKSVLPAVLLHTLIAVGSEMLCLRGNPAISVGVPAGARSGKGLGEAG
ncbi:MAG: CPBP family intramembrane glutamic endopeptidase [Planctomycetota bacterium]|jgi:membrane protease YdiL (CAAX protease family)